MKTKGSMTIFACVTMLFVSQVLLVLLEASRRSLIQRCADCELRAEIESVFASYSTPLWEEFQILGWDDSTTEMEEIIAKMDEYNHGTLNTDLLRLTKTKEFNTQKMLLTDGGGLAFENAVVAYMKMNFLGELLDRIEQNSEQIKTLESGKKGELDYYLSNVEKAKAAIDKFKKKQNGGGHNIVFRGTKRTSVSKTEPLKEETVKLEDMEGPIGLMISSLKNGFAGYIISGSNKVSKQKVEKSALLSNRTLREGNEYLERDISVLDRMLFLEYIYSRFGYLGNEKENRALSYEWEYILNGFDSDVLNLNATLLRLLVVRMAANMISIIEDEAKVNEADLYGGILASLILEPETKDLFKSAVLASWVYAESVLDLRTLCKGKKVSVLKGKDDWTLSSYLLAMPYLIGNKTAKTSEEGLLYEDYIKAMLFMKSDHHLSFRAMDLQEQCIRLKEGRSGFRLDNIVCEVSVEQEYKTKAIFWQMASLLSTGRSGYYYTSKQRYSYWKNK